MICQDCRERRHEECRGGSWCACQHRTTPATPAARAERGRDAAERDGSAGTEPPVNWVRQG
ncbi:MULTISPECIES: hypothetical protein [Thermomonospora]|uniref:Uncharacterized protein n=1 Tax=Thermomonospora cellulosilytica TaxID=1411118 RepID=A0A7W3MZA3_9ACTN|nr:MULTISPECIES: hypothetical protein [Thermomonospora]MBA9004647.1 hypothetical protein [Thermomonospora cellulosilytica]